MKKNYWQKSKDILIQSEKELSAKIVPEILLKIKDKKNFTVLLEGDLGAGKTTLVRVLLQSLGLPSNIPVQSPSYPLLIDYEINGSWYAHLDLYRIRENLTLDGFLELIAKSYRGIFIEWLPNDQEFLKELTPDILVKITINQAASKEIQSSRHFEIFYPCR